MKKKTARNALRCSGTPRISGKLFTGLSVGSTAALCIIVIQTGETHTHTHTRKDVGVLPPSRLVKVRYLYISK